jgi:hypothetical protein
MTHHEALVTRGSLKERDLYASRGSTSLARALPREPIRRAVHLGPHTYTIDATKLAGGFDNAVSSGVRSIPAHYLQASGSTRYGLYRRRTSTEVLRDTLSNSKLRFDLDISYSG